MRNILIEEECLLNENLNINDIRFAFVKTPYWDKIDDDSKVNLENFISNLIELNVNVEEIDLNNFKIISENNIPFAGGLGSSAASISAGLLIGNHLSGNKLNNDDIMQMAIAMEGHPDNATPCIHGGLTISFYDETKSRWIYKKIETNSDLNIMTFVPNFISETNQSRKKIPSEVLLKDAVNNISRVALLIDSLKSGDYSYLKSVLDIKNTKLFLINNTISKEIISGCILFFH